jgi:hypothetical protein
VTNVYDLEACELSYRFYGGRAGQKIGILIDGEPWIAKYPRSGRGLSGRHVPSYTSSPVAEWLGSHIYESAGIPAHETRLGWHGGKVVCACRDFCVGGAQLVEFSRLKNTLSDDVEDFLGSPSDGEVIFLQDVLSTLSLVDLLRQTSGVRERFWDMFVMDAFIKNPDRNNGNWGILLGGGLPPRLAPVYDNGSSLFSKRSASLTAGRTGDVRQEHEDAFGTNVSCYRLADDDDPRGRAVKPFEYLMTTTNPDAAAATLRAREAIDLDAVFALVDEVPEEAYGRVLMTEGQRTSHKRLLRLRYEEGILPAAERFERLGLA